MTCKAPQKMRKNKTQKTAQGVMHLAQKFSITSQLTEMGIDPICSNCYCSYLLGYSDNSNSKWLKPPALYPIFPISVNSATIHSGSDAHPRKFRATCDDPSLTFHVQVTQNPI